MIAHSTSSKRTVTPDYNGPRLSPSIITVPPEVGAEEIEEMVGALLALK